ncbi:hypothetical protein CYMTET_7596 [Cymbomonas tetramitiformis]|uniref:Chromo domain-containing protein n=1 Tax=Cymbomonas tetramitiformis TaxID=36881 RepID=A0AAE0GV84_9CHLO|nr:hypothetical protein CYMTET_7596 [Cymbomonas tetramitiformis]
MIFPNEQGVTMEHFTIDTKRDSRLGELTADFAQTLFQDTGFTAMRIPLRAAYYPDSNYTSCPWSGHPYLGFVNASAYACSVALIEFANAVPNGMPKWQTEIPLARQVKPIRGGDEKEEFLVHWTGYSHSHDSWKSRDSLNFGGELEQLKDFEDARLSQEGQNREKAL